MSERFDPGEDDFRYMPATDDLGFYSRVEEVAESNKIPNKGSGEQMLNTIKGQPGVKDDEIKWLGLDEFLEGKKQVTKDELTDFIRENDLQMEEVIKRPAQPEKVLLDENNPMSVNYQRVPGSTRFDEQTLPGAEPGTYREVLLKIKPKQKKITELPKGWTIEPHRDVQRLSHYRLKVPYTHWGFSGDGERVGHFVERSLEGSTKEEAFKSAVRIAQEKGLLPKDKSFKSSHWEEPNVIAHLRFNERKGANGERILFLEELQSDWHIQGRKKGYGDRVPDAPFKSSWHELALKRMLRFAAEGNYDKLAWIDGEETAKRYDLSKKISEVMYNETSQALHAYDKAGEIVLLERSVPPEKIAGYIGKEPAERLLNQPLDKAPPGAEHIKTKRLKGEDLKVGGEWAYNLYDRMVPQFLKKYGKKWGSRVSKGRFFLTVINTKVRLWFQENSSLSTSLQR